MRIRGGPSRHSIGQWLVCGVFAVCAAGLLVGAVYVPVRTIDVEDNGIRTSALVQDERRDGRKTDYELSFTLQDGLSFDTWTSDVHAGTHVGASIQIAYLAADPGSAEDVRDLGTWWLAPLIFAPVGGFLGCSGWTMWRLTPEAFLFLLRSRAGHRR
ncbi:DUF3592 domain-containing protein [Actinospica robiniae]|uniref:DUF3592 domain-containing protein n=1 Tax=Actinospica robiniae TaxID=304901 RepID=UPI0012F813D0|nr:DUF3592 domain-containing protein [Actinospica robiniae]